MNTMTIQEAIKATDPQVNPSMPPKEIEQCVKRALFAFARLLKFSCENKPGDVIAIKQCALNWWQVHGLYSNQENVMDFLDYYYRKAAFSFGRGIDSIIEQATQNPPPFPYEVLMDTDTNRKVFGVVFHLARATKGRFAISTHSLKPTLSPMQVNRSLNAMERAGIIQKIKKGFYNPQGQSQASTFLWTFDNVT